MSDLTIITRDGTIPKEYELCWRCGKTFTGKKIDGRPVCTFCMLRDAKANHGVLPNYSDLTPIYQKHDTPPPQNEPVVKPKPAPKVKKKREPKPLTPRQKAELRSLTK